ncbi:hypothetical protein GCM10027451_52090 [Geodermatophilus aquaeductus]
MPLTSRLRLVPVAALTAVLVPLLGTGPATADDEPAAGDTVVGELVQAWAEHADADDAAAHADDALVSWVSADDGTSVRVETEGVADVPVGATVEVTLGDEVPDPAGAQEPVHEVLDADVVAPAETVPPAPASAPYTNEVTVVRVLPRGVSADGTTVQQLVDQVNGPVADFWETQSDGAVRVHATAGPEAWISSDVLCDSSSALWDDVDRQLADWTPGPGKHLLLYVPGYSDPRDPCAFGLARIGTSRGAGGSLYVRAVETSVIAHELGHNFGLGHSSAVQCDASPETAPCETDAYADYYDVMGYSWGEVGSLNAPQAARLGLLPSSAQVSVGSSTPGGTWTLAPLGGRTGTRVLALTAADGAGYWVEYRTAVGQDDWLGDPDRNWVDVEPGVLVHRTGPGPRSDTALLLDGTPSPVARWDSDFQTVLPADASVTLGGSLTVRVTATSATGATVSVTTPADGPMSDSPITARWTALGGAGSWLGAPATAEVCGLRDGGCRRDFANGSIYWSPASGAQPVNGALRSRWQQLGAENGFLGYPTGAAVCGLRDSGCGQVFQGGAVYWSAASGAQPVNGAIRSRHASLGYENGFLGYPTGAAVCGLRDGGCGQVFQGGAVYWSAASGAQPVNGAIRSRHASLGYENGFLGYPTGAAVCGLRDGGCGQVFQGGTLYWSPASGTQPVNGAIRARWAQLGFENGSLGYPVEEAAVLFNGDVAQRFQSGGLYWSARTGQVRAY